MFSASSSEPEPELRAGMGDFATLICGATDVDALFFQRHFKIVEDAELKLIVKD